LDKGDPDIFWTNQSCNIHNAKANEETGKEIIQQLEGKVDAWVASIGTGGTFLGIAEAIKQEN
jgi:cysteine synthase A